MLNTIKTNALTAVKELVEIAKLEKDDILVIGCSSSEMLGEKIGSHSSVEAAEAAFRPPWFQHPHPRSFPPAVWPHGGMSGVSPVQSFPCGQSAPAAPRGQIPS